MAIIFRVCGERPMWMKDRNYQQTFVFNWKTKEFDRDPGYGLRILFNKQVDELEIVTEEEFREQVEKYGGKLPQSM